LLGKAGITSNYAFTGFSKERLDKARAVNPKFEMMPIPPLKGLGSSEGAYMKQPGFFGLYALNKNLATDEGKLDKVLKMLDDQIGDEGANFIKWGVEGVHYKNENGVKVATDLGKTEGPSKYSLTNHAQEGDWTILAADTPEVIKLKQASAPIAMTGTPWLQQETGLYSKAFADKGEDLKKFMTDGMIKIVMGAQPVDSVDKLFEDWKARGGDQVLKEMNDAWKARK
jgi:putative aldouronate transport system substrate-binding protein